MIGALLGLVEALRANGVRVSTAEGLDGARMRSRVSSSKPARRSAVTSGGSSPSGPPSRCSIKSCHSSSKIG